MHTLAALVAAGLVAAPTAPGGSGGARIDAGSTVYDVATGSYRLEGGVVITRGLVRLRANSARWDPRSNAVDAAGGILLTDGTRAIAAEGIHAVLDGEFEATQVVAFLKSGPVDLSGAKDAASAATCGRNALTARAERVAGTRTGPLLMRQARVTLCDCPDGGPPSWELRASAAVIHPGDRVELTWPVLWITPRFLLVERPVPILVLPWISLPLGERVSGLLAPQYASSGNAGQVLTLPYYRTLGQSADVTLAPRYALGSKDTAGQPPTSVRGPGASLEGRVAPSIGSAARLQLDTLWDLDRVTDEVNGVPGAHRLRLALSGAWHERLGEEGDLHADLDLVGDPLYTRDFAFDLLQRDAPSRRSALVASRRLGQVVVEMSAAWLEPVEQDRPRTPPSSPALADLATLRGGLFEARLPAFHRWPSVEATLVPVDLLGPVQLSGRAGLARFAPLSGSTSDGGADGVGPADRGLPSGSAGRPWQPWQRSLLDGTELDGRWQPGERLAATRLDARAELAAPFSLGDRLAVRPFVRGAVLGYSFDAVEAARANAWGLAGLELSTGFSRRYGELRHVIEPRAEWRLGSAIAGRALPAFGYDGWDRAPTTPAGVDPAFQAPRLASAAPPGVYQQARLALATRLESGAKELFRVELGQEVDLGRGRLTEATLDASGGASGLTGEAQLRFWPERRWLAVTPPVHPSWLDAFSELRLRLTARDPRGNAFMAGLTALGPGGSSRLGAGVDALFDPRPSGLGPQAAGTVGTRVRLGPALVGYDVVLPARPSTPFCNATSTRTVAAWQPQQQTVSLEWDSPCECFRARASLVFDDCQKTLTFKTPPGFNVSFDLGRVGASTGR